MSLLALRNLAQEKVRLLISVGGVAFAIVLMLILLGIYNGAVAQFTLIVERNPAHLFVAKEGITDFFHGVSLIEASQLDRLERDPSVLEIVPVVTQRAIVPQGNNKYDVIVFSFEPRSALGAPWRLTAGDKQLKKGEIALSESLADKLGKRLGDTIVVQATTLRITALAAEASSFGNHYAWVTLEQARAMVNDEGLTNFAYVSVKDPGEARGVARRLASADGQLSVLDKQTFIANNRAELEESFLPIIQAMVGIAVVIGIAVIALTIYTATIDKTREYGILKALGITNRQLYLVVLIQAVASTLLGLLAGTLLALLAARGLVVWIDLEPQLTAGTIAVVAAIGLMMGLAASLLPVRRLARIDPAEVFRA